MPPRPAPKAKERPVSAIYLGNGSRLSGGSGGSTSQLSLPSSSPHLANGLSSNLPELPGPPSPVSSHGSSDSGLPSPPATNSTGSGSTGDPGSVPRRQRPLSLASDSSTSTGSSTHKAMSEILRRGTPASASASRSNSRLANRDDYDEEDDVNDNEEDNTARLDRRFHMKSSRENAPAKQRTVMSLTQRNQMAIDKLSRLSPSPSPRSRSPVPSHASATTSSRLRQITSVSRTPSRDHAHSGSETEREDVSVVQSNSSYSQSSSSQASSSKRPVTPVSKPTQSQPGSPRSRSRHISAPESPQHARLLNAVSRGSGSGDSPSSRRQPRTSMSTITQRDDDEDEGINDGRYSRLSTAGRGRDRSERDTVRDITQSALAAVASSRQSPTSTRRRGALPSAFRDDSTSLSSADVVSTAGSARTRRSEDVSARLSRLNVEPVTPHRSNGVGRSATLRETRYTDPSRTEYRRAESPELSPIEARRERRQSTRGGSAESALAARNSGGRTLAGEGLRAAGLTPKRGESRNGDLSRVEDWHIDTEDKGKRRSTTYSRASTSMANYRYLDNQEGEIDDKGSRIRTHRTTHSVAPSLARDRSSIIGHSRDMSVTRTERESTRLDLDSPATRTPAGRTSTLPLSKGTPQYLTDRYSTASPIGSKRAGASTPAPGMGEPSRLMHESLCAFEAIVNKLPPIASTSLGSVPTNMELLKHAQILVNAAERVSTLMKQGTGRALEAQISMEVEDDNSGSTQDMLEVWREVGGDYREGFRAAEELVRSVTSVLMDTGTIFRKLAAASTVNDVPSPATHARNVSLDDEGLRQHQRVTAGSEVASGRRSAASRRSWEPSLPDRDREREETLRKLGGGRESALGMARASPALRVRDRVRAGLQTPSPSSGTRPLSSLGTTSSRRSYTSRDTPSQSSHEALDSSGSSRESRPLPALQTSDSQRTLKTVERERPSPSPMPRTMGRDRSRTLPAAPPPLATLPSEQARRTPVTRTPTSATVERASTVRYERRKPSNTSITTVRASGPPSLTSLMTPSSTTTLVSHHTVSSSPEVSTGENPMLLPRSNSGRSIRQTVVFSHPSSTSVSEALTDIQRNAEGRKSYTREDKGSEPPTPTAKTPARLTAPGISKMRSEDAKRVNRSVSLTARPSSSRASLDEFGALRGHSESPGPSLVRRSTAHPADRSAVSTILTSNGNTSRTNRRTVTDVWPSEGS